MSRRSDDYDDARQAHAQRRGPCANLDTTRADYLREKAPCVLMGSCMVPVIYKDPKDLRCKHNDVCAYHSASREK